MTQTRELKNKDKQMETTWDKHDIIHLVAKECHITGWQTCSVKG